MKAVKLNLFSLFMVMLLCTGMHHLQAQQEINVETDGKTITIIKKYVDDEGISVTEKIVKQVDDPSGFDIDNFISDIPGTEITIDVMEDERMDLLNNSMDRMDAFMFGKSGCDSKSMRKSTDNRGKLGVYLDTRADIEEGVRINSIVKGGAAEQIGMQAGDIILAINDEKTNGYPALSKVMRDYKVDDVVRVNYQRGTEYFQSEVTLKGHIRPERKPRYAYVSPSDRSYYKMDPCKPFIGVTLSSQGENGVPIHRVIEDTPASEVALQKGDRITSIDGKKVYSQSEIVRLRDLHKAGDYFTIGYTRDGQEYEVEAQFKACDSETVVDEKEEEQPTNLARPDIQPIVTNDLRLESVTAFPNPTSGRITLQFKGEAVPTTVRLTDALGKILMTEKLNDFSGEYNDRINLSNYPSGIYNITIIQNGKSYNERIVLNANRT